MSSMINMEKSNERSAFSMLFSSSTIRQYYGIQDERGDVTHSASYVWVIPLSRAEKETEKTQVCRDREEGSEEIENLWPGTINRQDTSWITARLCHVIVVQKRTVPSTIKVDLFSPRIFHSCILVSKMKRLVVCGRFSWALTCYPGAWLDSQQDYCDAVCTDALAWQTCKSFSILKKVRTEPCFWPIFQIFCGNSNDTWSVTTNRKQTVTPYTVSVHTQIWWNLQSTRLLLLLRKEKRCR